MHYVTSEMKSALRIYSRAIGNAVKADGKWFYRSDGEINVTVGKVSTNRVEDRWKYVLCEGGQG